jgi:hypothetical protein
MPDLDFLAAAYDSGQAFGRAFRWMLVLVAGLAIGIRLVRGFVGPGFGRSRLGLAVSVVAVVVALIGSLHYDFGSNRASAAGPDLAEARTEVMLGCLDQGQTRRVCECYGDEVLRRIDRSPERFAALERDMIARQNAGREPPPMLTEAAQYCAGRG